LSINPVEAAVVVKGTAIRNSDKMRRFYYSVMSQAEGRLSLTHEEGNAHTCDPQAMQIVG
jgi:hypothetical protein